MNITKILFSVMAGVIITTPTLAAKTMCITNDNTNIILNPGIDGFASGRNEAEKTWWADFDYGRISGDARCTDVQPAWGAYPEYDFYNYPAGTVITNEDYKYCWCKMTSPVRSAWVYYDGRYATNEVCQMYCARHCSEDMLPDHGFRESLFGSAGM